MSLPNRLALVLFASALAAPALAAPANRVTITRDEWGIAHIHGHTDADAVYCMIYAQAEDDFPRIERNYLTNLGRLAEAEGEPALWQDLRQRLLDLIMYGSEAPKSGVRSDAGGAGARTTTGLSVTRTRSARAASALRSPSP